MSSLYIFISLLSATIYGAGALPSFPVASHAEVSFFRAKEAAVITEQKGTHHTQLEVLGSLLALENKHERGELSNFAFARLTLGMMIGNGYQEGVCSHLRASPSEIKQISRIIEKASIPVSVLNFSDRNIWSSNITAAQKTQHAAFLNNIRNGFATAQPAKYTLEVEGATPYERNKANDLRIFEGEFSIVPHLLMNALYKESAKERCASIVRFIDYFDKLDNASKTIVRDWLAIKGENEASIARLVNKYIACSVVEAPPMVFAAPSPRREYENIISPYIIEPQYQAMLNAFIDTAVDTTDLPISLKDFIETFIRLDDANRNKVYVELGNFIEPSFRVVRRAENEVNAFKGLDIFRRAEVLMNLHFYQEDQIAAHTFRRNLNPTFPLKGAGVPARGHGWGGVGGLRDGPAVRDGGGFGVGGFAGGVRRKILKQVPDQLPDNNFIRQLIKDIQLASFEQAADASLEKQIDADYSMLLQEVKEIARDAFLGDIINMGNLLKIQEFVENFSRLRDADKANILDHLKRQIGLGIYQKGEDDLSPGQYAIQFKDPILGAYDRGKGIYAIMGYKNEKRNIPRVGALVDTARKPIMVTVGKILLPDGYPDHANALLKSKALLVIDTCNYLQTQLRARMLMLIPEEVEEDISGRFRWNFWKGPTGKALATGHYNPPADLTADGTRFIDFIMNHVMPKLEALYYQGKITARDVGYVLRAAGMGFAGIEEQDAYLASFRRQFVENCTPVYGGKIAISAGQISVNPAIFSKLGIAVTSLPFDSILPKKDLGITQFYLLHGENQLRVYQAKYNQAVDRGELNAAKKEELKSEVEQLFLSCVRMLPEVIMRGFTQLFALDNEEKIIEFIKSFDTTNCYDGTTDTIQECARRLGVSFEDGGAAAAENPEIKEKKRFLKLINDIMNGENPAGLAATITDAALEAFATLAKTSDADEAPPKDAIVTAPDQLETSFGGEEGARAIRVFVGNNANGSPKLTDQQVLGLLYWAGRRLVEYKAGIPAEIADLFPQ